MPKAEIITIGDELLSGETVDTNSNYLDQTLADLGWEVTRHTTVVDDIGEISTAIRESAARARLVITSGGLGPTEDDLTLEALAHALGCGVRLDQPTLDKIAERFRSFGREMTPNNARQARVPEIGEIIENGAGTAPGFLAPLGESEVLLLPGVPREVRWIAEHTLATRFRLDAPFAVRRTLKLIGFGESRLAETVTPVVDRHRSTIRIGYRAIATETHLKLMARVDEFDSVDHCREAVASCEADLRGLLGDRIYGADNETLVEGLAERLTQRSATIGTAESCTGGLIAKLLTDRPGSSSYFLGGCATYSNESKSTLLGVDPDLIEQQGAVSAEVAEAMALGIRDRLGCTWGLSATGVAGPGGGTPAKPVGTVFVGLAGPEGVECKKLQVVGDRDMVRTNTAKILLDSLRRRLGTS